MARAEPPDTPPRSAKVILRYAAGDRRDNAMVIGPYHPSMPGWYRVRLEDGTRLGVHRSMLDRRNVA